MSHCWALAFAATVALILFSSPVSAQNMIGNGDFDTDVSGWTPWTIQFEWDPADCQQSPTSGAGLATNDHDGPMHTGVMACIDGVTPGQIYDLGGMLRVPTGQAGIGSAYIGFYWYDAPGCTGIQSWVGGTPWVATSDNWVSVTMWGNVAPPGTQSAWVGLNSSKTSAGTDAYLSYYDNVYFGVFGGVFADGFESGSTNFWSATID